MIESKRISNLPPYIFARLNKLKIEARKEGRDIIDLGMGNPDQPPAPKIIEKLIQTAQNPRVHGYSSSKGIPNLRKAITRRYKAQYDVDIDPETEVVVTIGVKEGFSHLLLSVLDEGDNIILPTPTYPSHIYHTVIAGGNLITVPLLDENSFIPKLEDAIKNAHKKPKLLVISFPNNPTTMVVSLEFFNDIVEFAKKHEITVIHDFAYADMGFDGYKAPSFLQAKDAKKVGAEFYSLSKTYNMAGWRIGFLVGRADIVSALTKIKSYYDYGLFTPVQVASIQALDGPQDYVEKTMEEYKRRRDVFIRGLDSMGWHIETPKATMYIWAPIPEKFKKEGSLNFSVRILKEADVVCSPGAGFGDNGEGFLRFALVENEHRIKQAIRGIKKVIQG
ncbi:MAG: aminotransferase class I/II-fold pyridoxal phosphate-dependent enzyme [Candidatus Ratteibacteria bacterium]|nr:aminotransferase class I/II-fold pyridoxal phosphate-dependent enzyme [Candidatus Ratteibacteria bacterium]